MSGILSESEIVNGLVSQGVPRHMAERTARAQASRANTFGARYDPDLHIATSASDATSLQVNVQFVGPLLLPIRLRIPWSCLISDNARKKPARRGDGVIEVMTPEYRVAKKAIATLAADVMQGRPPADCPLSLVARVWVPNVNRRDVVNLSKALHDALTGIVFTDDHWLHDTRWIRAGVDVDAPRAEIVITPLST